MSTNISVTGIGYSSLGVSAFKSRKFIHTLKEPFFLITDTILAIHSTYLVVLMNLQQRSLSTSVLIFERISGANLLGVCLMGFFPSFIGNLNSTSSLSKPGIHHSPRRSNLYFLLVTQ